MYGVVEVADVDSPDSNTDDRDDLERRMEKWEG